MNAGKLNRRIVVLTQATTRDSLGAKIKSDWVPVATVWASLDIQTTQLLYQTAEFVEKAIWRITVRYSKSFTYLPTMRLQYTDQSKGLVHMYSIETIMNDKQGNDVIVLMCHELNGGA